MKSQILVFILSIFLLQNAAKAQVVFQGKIDYQRKMNIHRQFDDMGGESNSYMEAWLAKVPKYDTRVFTLYFNKDESKYAPVKQEENASLNMMGGLPGTQTEVYTNVKTQQVTAFKKVYEQNFLIVDSAKKLEWKILEEVRDIAGYSCRKAVAKMNDSVVVVAFYTDKIVVSTGPEMFSGLPGMILEIAIPRLHTTWIAQSVSIEPLKTDALLIPDKGKKSTLTEMAKSIKESTKNWGKFSDKSVWWSSL